MRLFLLILCLSVYFVLCATKQQRKQAKLYPNNPSGLKTEWSSFKLTHRRAYKNYTEEQKRFFFIYLSE